MALAESTGDDSVGLVAEADERVSDRVGALSRQRVVALLRADRVRVALDREVALARGEQDRRDLLDLALGLREEDRSIGSEQQAPG